MGVIVAQAVSDRHGMELPAQNESHAIVRQGTPQIDEMLQLSAWASGGRKKRGGLLQNTRAESPLPTTANFDDTLQTLVALNGKFPQPNPNQKTSGLKRQVTPHASMMSEVRSWASATRGQGKKISRLETHSEVPALMPSKGEMSSPGSLKRQIVRQATPRAQDLSRLRLETLRRPSLESHPECASEESPELPNGPAIDASSQPGRPHVPVIDFAAFATAVVPPDGERFVPTERQRETAGRIREALETHGFIYAGGLMPPSAVSDALEAARTIFAPSTDRTLLRPRDFKINAGYTGFQKEGLNPRREKDTKEVFSIRKYNLMPEPGSDVMHGTPPSFPKAANAAWHACESASTRALLAFGLAMDLEDPATFARSVVPEDTLSTLRFIHYTGSKHRRRYTSNSDTQSIACGEHTDLGLVTVLLLEDESPGLQVKQENGSWMPATGRKGTVLLNTGAILSRWCNNAVAATPHRVVDIPQDRYSVAFFCHADAAQNIDPLPQFVDPGCMDNDGSKPHVTAGQFVDECLESVLTGKISDLAKTWLISE